MDLSDFFSSFNLPLFHPHKIGALKINIKYAAILKGDTPDAHCLIWVRRGHMTIGNSEKQFFIEANMFSDFLLFPHWHIIETSDDIEAYGLFIDENFFHSIFPCRPPMPIEYIKMMDKKYVIQLDALAIKTLTIQWENIADTLSYERKLYSHQLIELRIQILFLELQNINKRLSLTKLTSKSNITHQERIFSNLVTALDNHIEKSHNVKFYANILCVSPQYLGRVVRNVSNATVSELIQKHLIREIKKLLLDNAISITQIANILNFADHIVMSKYFKRYTGITPSEYRKLISK